MIVTVPHYYSQFHCIAGACTDTCCAGWQIVIDEHSMKKYQHLKGRFGRRLRRSIDKKESSFKQNGHRCAFLNENNLCDIYREEGPKMLCRTCRNYPRKIEEYEDCREISLSLSCVEAARLILGQKEPVQFFTREREGEESDEDFDFFLYTKLMDVREELFAVMQDRSCSVRTRMAMALSLTHDVQRRIRQGRLFEIDELLDRYGSETAPERFDRKLETFEKEPEQRFQIMKQIFQIFERLEPLKEDWKGYTRSLWKQLYETGPADYMENRTAFLQSRKEQGEEWSLWTEQLMVYFIFSHFCGAVYDENAYGRIKFAVVSTLLIQEMAQAVWCLQDQTFDFDDLVEIAHRYAKEVEHSDLNLEEFQKSFRTNEEFRLKELLKAILS